LLGKFGATCAGMGLMHNYFAIRGHQGFRSDETRAVLKKSSAETAP